MHPVPDTAPHPTADDVVAMFRRIHRDGPTRHADELGELADAAGRLGADPPLVALVTDRSAPDEIRIRAVARLARQWPSLVAAATVADPGFAGTLAALLARWNAHHDLRAVGADVADLAESRRAVDAARRAHITARQPLRSTG